MVSIARIFRNGASQAIRLPKEFRFEGDEVCIKRIGAAVLVFPKDAAWPLTAEALGQADEDFMPERNQPAAPDPRKSL
jgi:antitoxin VapB